MRFYCSTMRLPLAGDASMKLALLLSFKGDGCDGLWLTVLPDLEPLAVTLEEFLFERYLLNHSTPFMLYSPVPNDLTEPFCEPERSSF